MTFKNMNIIVVLVFVLSVLFVLVGNNCILTGEWESEKSHNIDNNSNQQPNRW